MARREQVLPAQRQQSLPSRMRTGQSGAGMVPMFLGRRVPAQQSGKPQ